MEEWKKQEALSDRERELWCNERLGSVWKTSTSSPYMTQSACSISTLTLGQECATMTTTKLNGPWVGGPAARLIVVTSTS